MRRMLRVGLGVVWLAATPAAAQVAAPAGGEGMDGFYGATLVIDIPGQWHAERTFRPDHTYRDHGDDGDVGGAWTVENGKVCTTPDKRLADRAATYCNLGVGRRPGDKWTDADPVTGATLFFELKPGGPKG